MILDELCRGMSVASVGHEYYVNSSTMHTIRSSEDKIHTGVKASIPVSAKVSQRSPLIEMIEVIVCGPMIK